MQLAKMSIDPKFVGLTAHEFGSFVFNIFNNERRSRNSEHLDADNRNLSVVVLAYGPALTIHHKQSRTSMAPN